MKEDEKVDFFDGILNHEETCPICTGDDEHAAELKGDKENFYLKLKECKYKWESFLKSLLKNAAHPIKVFHLWLMLGLKYDNKNKAKELLNNLKNYD